jgi:hypothetical protein
VAHYDLLGKGANPRKLVSRAENTCINGMLNLLHELEVKGLTGLRVEFEIHNCTTVNVQHANLCSKYVQCRRLPSSE